MEQSCVNHLLQAFHFIKYMNPKSLKIQIKIKSWDNLQTVFQRRMHFSSKIKLEWNKKNSIKRKRVNYEKFINFWRNVFTQKSIIFTPTFSHIYARWTKNQLNRKKSKLNWKNNIFSVKLQPVKVCVHN